MQSAGFGDMVAKYVGLVDWQISSLLTGEYYCERIASLTRSAVDELMEMADRVCVNDEETAGKIFEALLMTEQTLARKRSHLENIKVAIADPSKIEEIRAVFEKYNSILPKNITSSRSFRLFYLRALIDSEIVRNDGYSIRSELCQQAMREIDEIYFVNEKTCPWVRPATGK